jgi:hypothetical protein
MGTTDFHEGSRLEVRSAARYAVVTGLMEADGVPTRVMGGGNDAAEGP